MHCERLNLRLPSDLKSWAEARALLTNQSLNAAIVALLEDARESDPLAKLAVIERGGRYIVASGSTREEYKAFMREDLAMDFARAALSMAGANPNNILELTDGRAEAAEPV